MRRRSNLQLKLTCRQMERGRNFPGGDRASLDGRHREPRLGAARWLGAHLPVPPLTRPASPIQCSLG